MATDPTERALELAARVIAPLVLGGPIRPVRPLGPQLALELGLVERIPDDELRFRIDEARLRRARSIVPVDVLPDLSPAEWATAGALNDLLQVSNDELSGVGTRARHRRLLEATLELCHLVPPPQHLADAVARHGTFALVLDTTRADRHVSWWTGSAHFRGRTPPARLLKWRSWRRVQVTTTTISFADMADGVPVREENFEHVLAAVVACSPLTDLACADRERAPFSWSPGTLAVAATVAGSNLALRAFARRQPSAEAWLDCCERRAGAAMQALRRSMDTLKPGSSAHHIAARFVQRLADAQQLWTERASA